MKSINILGIKCPVKECDIKKTLSEDALGLTDLLENKIYIEKFQPEDSKKRTLVHEAVHVALWHSGVHFTLSPDMCETLCQVMSALYFELKKQKV